VFKKDYRFEFKGLNDDGEFEGLASTFKNKDLQGDVIEPGAFAQTITQRKNAFPVLWQHDPSQPIGRMMPEDMEETARGLKVKGRLTLSVAKAVEARDLARDGVLGGMSIGFEIPKGQSQMDHSRGVRRIKQVRLWEVSFVTFPANPKAVFSGVKNIDDADAMMEDAMRALSRARIYGTDETRAAAFLALEKALALLKGYEISPELGDAHADLDDLGSDGAADPQEELGEVATDSLHAWKRLNERMQELKDHGAKLG